MKAFIILTLFGVIAIAQTARLHPNSLAEEIPPEVKCTWPPSQDKDELLPDPKDCSSFYHCAYGVPAKKKCPQGLHFNKDKLYCDWVWQAGCDPAFSTTTTVKPEIAETDVCL